MKRHWLLIAFVGGLVMGVAAGFVLAESRERHTPTYVLESDLDLTKTFFFKGHPTPVRGTIAAGSQFQVELRYSHADYIAFRTVVDRDQLMSISKALPAK